MNRNRHRIDGVEPIKCLCGHVIFDGDVIRSRVIKVTKEGCTAKCRCKRWIRVPLRLNGGSSI